VKWPFLGRLGPKNAAFAEWAGRAGKFKGQNRILGAISPTGAPGWAKIQGLPANGPGLPPRVPPTFWGSKVASGSPFWAILGPENGDFARDIPKKRPF
jgi:hypothetical protein